MGGDYEKKVEPKKAEERIDVAEGVTPTPGVRFHISKGEVHFHDDVNKLKVAMPVAEFDIVWRNLKRNKPCSFIDEVNLTSLEICIYCSGLGTNHLSTRIVIQKMTVDDTFKKLSDFANRR